MWAVITVSYLMLVSGSNCTEGERFVEGLHFQSCADFLKKVNVNVDLAV